jgi:hypothetical protein
MITISLWGALGLIALGGAVAELYNLQAWRRYREGRIDANKSQGYYKR